jgi:ATP-dependent exoDNAse (exonuclease V) beta subunit
MYIIPKKYDAAKVRLEIKKQMAAEGKESVLVPELGTLYDVALEKSGIGRGRGLGKVIMKEDFFCLLDHIKELPAKFKGNNRNYKSAIFALLNEMAFDSEELDSYRFHNTVHIAGLTKAYCRMIYNTVRERGFLFRAEVYHKAIDSIEKSGIPAGEEYILIPGEYYTHLEQELLNKLGAKPLNTKNKNQALCTAMFSDDLTGDFQITNPEKMVGFLKADTVMDQFIEVKNHILAVMKKDPSLKLDDFCLVLGTEDSLALCTSYYETIGFHPVSSASVQAETPLLDGLTLISYALSGDTEKLIRYYNRHHGDEEKVVYDPTFDFEDFWKFSARLAKSDGSKYDKLRKVPEPFKEWIKKLSFIRNDNKIQSVAKNLDQIQRILKNLGLADESLYEYRTSPEQIFRNEKGEDRIQFKELVEYFKNILAGRKRNLVSTWDDGIVLVKMGEYVPNCRYIYFADMEENIFLKDKMPNLLLSNDEHDEFNTKVYGLTKEEHLKKWFATSIANAERTIFVIPFYDEGTVISEYAENALRLFPMEKRTVKVIGGDVPDFKHSFYRTFKEVKWENAKPQMAAIPESALFKPHVDDEDPQDYVLRHLGAATRIEDFMECPARFIYDCQQPDTQMQDEIHFTKGNAFHMFCELFFSRRFIRVFKIANTNLPLEVAKYISKLPCDSELAQYMDAMDVWDIFKRVSDKYPELELRDTDLLTYLVFVCRCMKDIMKDCDSTSIRLEVFFGGANVMEDPLVPVGEGYIDMMFRTNSGGVVLVDFKSGDISEYSDDVESFSNVQLLIYSHIVHEALEYRDFSVFLPTDEQKEKMKEKGKDESSILDKGYFDRIEKDAPIEAYYLSYKARDGFMPVSGLAGTDSPIEGFREKLGDLLALAGENVFKPSFNKDCTYCPLFSFCPDRESAQSLDAIYEKLDLKGPFYQEYPVPAEEPATSEGASDKTVKIIQFAEGSKYAAVGDFDDDIIISAGAGAGKTEVLTTRYLNLLINTKADLDNIVCITFTEKAAGEMKKRIFAKLRDTLSLGAFYSVPPDGEGVERYNLTEAQIQKLQNIRKNFFRNNRISTFHSFCLNMLTKFEKEDPASQRDLTSTVADDYMLRDRKVNIVSRLVEEYEKEYNVFLRWTAYLPFYYKTESGEGGVVADIIELLNEIKLSGIPITQASRDQLASEFEAKKQKAIDELWEKFEVVRDNLIEALEAFKAEEAAAGAKPSNLAKLDDEINRVTSGSSGSIKAYPYAKNPDLKALLKTYLSCPCPNTEESCSTEEEALIHYLLFDIMLKADREIEKYKIENSIIELSDYHLNLLSLMKNELILEGIRGDIHYIMVDEFQDTNWLQKKILDNLHDNHNRLFVVGDLKQSIYRFQQCDNQIFKFYRDQDSIMYITFQENFRSAEQIVKFNNRYFTENQVPEYCVIPNNSKDPGRPELGIPMCRPAPGVPVSIVELGYQTGAFQVLTQKEENILLRAQEGFYIARTIAATGKKNYGRWGILVREYTNINYILDALTRMNIPYSYCIKKNFFRQGEIEQVLIVLQVLYGFLPSGTLNANPVLADFVANYKDKDKGFCYAISSIMKLPVYAPVRPMLHELLLQCREFVRQCGENPEEVLTQLLDFAAENSKEINTSALDNGVRIMTVHSSKGLEFDYLFVSKISEYTGRGGFGGPKSGIDFINYVDEDKNQIIDYDITGIRTLVKDDRPMLYDSWMKSKNAEFDSEEKGNLLYVAFTRAKKHLVVTLQHGEFKGGLQANVNWLNNISGNILGFPEVSHEAELEIDWIEPVLKKDEKEQPYPVEEVSLPAPELATVSVSRYLDGLVEEPDLDDKITDAGELPESTGVKANEVGTAVHSFFEHNVADLAKADPAQFAVPKAMHSQFMTYAAAGLADPGYMALVSGADELRTEAAMIFHTPEGKLLNGVIDLIVRKGNTVTVLDYKTHSGSALDAATLERYKTQVGLYAHGLAALYPGCKFECCLLVMYSTGKSELVWC